MVTTIIRNRSKEGCRTCTTTKSTKKKPFEEDRIVSGEELARRFDELRESLGRSMMETIIYDLGIMYGIMTVGKLSYKLSRIEDAPTKLLGDSAYEIIMESTVKHLKQGK